MLTQLEPKKDTAAIYTKNTILNHNLTRPFHLVDECHLSDVMGLME